MNIGYIKIIKKKELNSKNLIKNYIYNTKINVKSKLNLVEQDKYHKDIFYLYNTKKESQNKIASKLFAENIKYAITEKGYHIDYPTLTDRYIMKSMIPELVDYCHKLIKTDIDEVYVCTEVFSFENVSIIEELTQKTKVVNVVTNHKRYRNLEKRLEERDIFITVSGNKRQSLKKAKILVNLDFENFNLYNINRNMVVIDITKNVQLPKSFNGIVIRGVNVNTKKVIRIFSDFEDFNKKDLLEAELAKINDYKKSREYILNNKIYIQNVYNKEQINLQEFVRIKGFYMKK